MARRDLVEGRRGPVARCLRLGSRRPYPTAMRYVRFANSSRLASHDGVAGVFRAAHLLEEHGALAEHERVWLAESDRWFAEHLRAPTQLALRGGYRQPKIALCWFKDTAQEHLLWIRSLVALLKEHGVVVRECGSAQPGYIVYEDEYQVAAVPFGAARRRDHRRRSL